MNELNLEKLKIELNKLFESHRIILIFEPKYITFQIDWIHNTGMISNLCISIPYKELIHSKKSIIEEICQVLKEEIKNDH